MSHPICPNCRQEIAPGSEVSMVLDPELDEDAGVFTHDQAVVTHETCPPSATLRALAYWIATLPPETLDLPLTCSTLLDPPPSKMSDLDLAEWVGRTASADFVPATPARISLWPSREDPHFVVLYLHEGVPVRDQAEIERVAAETGVDPTEGD